MDLLIVEPLEPEVVQWLEARYSVQSAPQLAQDPLALRRVLGQARAIIVPSSVAVDATLLKAAPRLKAIGRLSAGVETIDLEACALAGIEVVRPNGASAAAEAEFYRNNASEESLHTSQIQGAPRRVSRALRFCLFCLRFLLTLNFVCL